MNISDLVIGGCWIAFFAFWAAAALFYGGGNSQRSAWSSVVRLLIVVAIVVAVRVGGRGGPPPGFVHSPAGFAAAGAALSVIGLAFAIWARVTLGRSWGMPMTRHEQPELATAGPYAYVRHPIYTGITALFIGTSLAYPLSAVPSALVVAYFVFSARREERDMEQQFPGAYPAYKQRSKMLVPFLF